MCARAEFSRHFPGHAEKVSSFGLHLAFQSLSLADIFTVIPPSKYGQIKPSHPKQLRKSQSKLANPRRQWRKIVTIHKS